MPLLVRVPSWHEVHCLLGVPRRGLIIQSGHGDVAAHAAVMGGAEQTLIGGRLGLLRELLGLVCRRDFHLLGLAYQLIGFVEVGQP